MFRKAASPAILVCVMAVTACAADPTSVTGRWGSSVGEPGSYIEILTGGQMSGHDGCNAFSGRWSEAGAGQARFEEVATTLIGCLDEEQNGLVLASARTAEVKDGELVFFDLEGKELGALPRAG